MNSEVERSIFFSELCCNIKVRKSFELRRSIRNTSERHFPNVRRGYITRL